MKHLLAGHFSALVAAYERMLIEGGAVRVKDGVPTFISQEEMMAGELRGQSADLVLVDDPHGETRIFEGEFHVAAPPPTGFAGWGIHDILESLPKVEFPKPPKRNPERCIERPHKKWPVRR